MNMKKLSTLTAFALAGALATGTVLAEEVTLTACTKDGKTATIHADMTGGYKGGPTLEELSRQAFKESARMMDSHDVASNKGKLDFLITLLRIDTRGGIGIVPESNLYIDTVTIPTISDPRCTP